MEPLLHLLADMEKTAAVGSGLLLTLWPVLGLLTLSMLQAPWMIPALGKGLAWASATGRGAASMPKAGIMRLLFAPLVYGLIYAIAVAMAFADGLLGKVDPETRRLAGTLIAALRKAGAKDVLLYLEHKTLPPKQAAAVKTMQTSLSTGASSVDAAQAAILVADGFGPWEAKRK